MAANRRLYACDLLNSVTEDQLRALFPEGAAPLSVVFARGPTGKKLGYAILTFATPAVKDLALLQNGVDLGHGRRLILAVNQDGLRTPFYALFQKLPPQAKQPDLAAFLNLHTAGQNPLVIMPMQDNLNKGFGFAYPTNMEDFLSCLALDGSDFMGKTISVTPGLFLGGRGRRSST